MRQQKKRNYQKLKGRVVEKFGNIRNFTKAMGEAPSTISAKLNGADWRTEEIEKACELLDIPISEVYQYFFEN